MRCACQICTRSEWSCVQVKELRNYMKYMGVFGAVTEVFMFLPCYLALCAPGFVVRGYRVRRSARRPVTLSEGNVLIVVLYVLWL